MTKARSNAAAPAAKGDLQVGSGSLTSGVLGVGSDGAVLQADSTATNGVSWAGPLFAAGKNKIINGDFGIWQRGTSITIPNASWTFVSDRWQAYETYSAGSLVCSQQTFTPGSAPVSGYESAYFMRFTAPTTGTGGLNFRQLIEDVRVFAGQTVTLSFWAKASATTTVYSFAQQGFGSGGSAGVDSGSNSYSITTSWARYSYSWTIPSISGKTIGTGSSLSAYFYTSANFTAGATLDIWGVQLEAGSVATAFQTATGTIQGELAACQRYYVRFGGSASYSYQNLAGYTQTTTNAVLLGQGFSPLRVQPTAVDYANIYIIDSAGNTFTTSGITIDTNLSSGNGLAVNFAATGMTAGRWCYLRSNNSASGYIGFSAEL